MSTETTYNYKVVRQFAIMTIVWGVVGMSLGVFIAVEQMRIVIDRIGQRRTNLLTILLARFDIAKLCRYQSVIIFRQILLDQ